MPLSFVPANFQGLCPLLQASRLRNLQWMMYNLCYVYSLCVCGWLGSKHQLTNYLSLSLLLLFDISRQHHLLKWHLAQNHTSLMGQLHNTRACRHTHAFSLSLSLAHAHLHSSTHTYQWNLSEKSQHERQELPNGKTKILSLGRAMGYGTQICCQ